jgi:hypothetical protein
VRRVVRLGVRLKVGLVVRLNVPRCAVGRTAKVLSNEDDHSTELEHEDIYPQSHAGGFSPFRRSENFGILML